MVKKQIYGLFIMALLLFVSCGNPENSQEDTELNLWAAASLKEVLLEISEEYANEGGTGIAFNFAGSGTLKTQIVQGGKCDIFISASKDQMEELEKENLLEGETMVDLIGNSLALISSEEAEQLVSLENLGVEGIRTIAIGNPQSVPAGSYAMEVFENMKITESIKEKIILAKDVRSVLDYVETGNVDCGIVYKTDTLLLDRGVFIEDIPETLHSPIKYPVAILKSSESKKNALEFVEFLQSEKAMEIFEEYGYKPL